MALIRSSSDTTARPPSRASQHRRHRRRSLSARHAMVQVCAGLLWLLLSWPGAHAVAAAQTPAQRDFQRAQALFQEGRKLTLKRQFKAAIQRYNNAISLLENAERTTSLPAEKQRLRSARAGMLYVIGRTYQLDKQPTPAYIAYQRCLNTKPNPKLAAIVQRFASKLRPQVIATLALTTTPPGVQAVVTDAMGQTQRLTTPFRQELIPGKVQLQLQHPGYTPQTITLQLTPQGRVQRTIALRRIPTRQPKPPTGGTSGTSGATIGMWTSAAVAGVAAIVGVILLADGIPQEQRGLSCYGQPTKAECGQQTDASIADAIEGGQTKKIAGISLLGAAGAAAVVAIILSLNRRPPPTKKQVSVAPSNDRSHTALYATH